MKNNYGEFEEVNEEGTKAGNIENSNSEEGGRVKLPRNKELLGVIVQRLGGNRMDVLSSDGKTRNCRVPGRFKRVLWLRPKDIVLIEPWPDDDSKGDVIFKYTSSGINQLRKRLLNNLNVEF